MKAMRLIGLFVIVALASSNKDVASDLVQVPEPAHVVLPPRCYSFAIRELVLTHSEFRTGTINQWDPKPDRRFKVVYGEHLDSVYMYESESLISTFMSRNYCLFGEIRVYDKQGRLASIENFADSFGQYDDNVLPYYAIFKGRKHGRSEWFFPDGKRQKLVFYRQGLNDSFEQVKYNSGNVFSYTHKDTVIYYGEDDGIPDWKEHFTQRGKYRMYVEYTYWPKGKLRTEKYYFDKEKTVPCHTWKEYDRSGKLIKSVQKKGPYVMSERMSDPPYYFVETTPCDVKKILADSTRELLKRVSIRTPGEYRLKFSIGTGGGKLIELKGPYDYDRQLKYALEDILKACRYCYVKPYNGSSQEETDYYTLDFEISE